MKRKLYNIYRSDGKMIPIFNRPGPIKNTTLSPLAYSLLSGNSAIKIYPINSDPVEKQRLANIKESASIRKNKNAKPIAASTSINDVIGDASSIPEEELTVEEVVYSETPVNIKEEPEDVILPIAKDVIEEISYEECENDNVADVPETIEDIQCVIAEAPRSSTLNIEDTLEYNKCDDELTDTEIDAMLADNYAECENDGRSILISGTPPEIDGSPSSRTNASTRRYNIRTMKFMNESQLRKILLDRGFSAEDIGPIEGDVCEFLINKIRSTQIMGKASKNT